MDELDRVVVAAPCPISWELMPGNDRVRYCSSCSKNVYNISDMTSNEAQQFLEENGSSQCIRLFRRQDGKVMTDNCPLGLRAIRNRCRLVMKMVAGCAASLLAFIPNFRNLASAQPALPYDGEPTISAKDQSKTPQKPDQTKKPDKGTALPKPGPAPSMPASAGLVAFPTKEPTPNKKQVMVGGDVCPGSGTDQSKSAAPSHGFKMGKMAAPRPNNSQQNIPLEAAPNSKANPQKPDSKDDMNPGPKASLPGVQIEVIDTRDFSSMSLDEYTVKSKNGGFERDSKAYNLYQMAQKSEAEGRFLVAQAQYKGAIAAAKEQNGGDPKFQVMLSTSLSALQEKMKQQSAHN